MKIMNVTVLLKHMCAHDNITLTVPVRQYALIAFYVFVNYLTTGRRGAVSSRSISDISTEDIKNMSMTTSTCQQ